MGAFGDVYRENFRENDAIWRADSFFLFPENACWSLTKCMGLCQPDQQNDREFKWQSSEIEFSKVVKTYAPET